MTNAKETESKWSYKTGPAKPRKYGPAQAAYLREWRRRRREADPDPRPPGRLRLPRKMTDAQLKHRELQLAVWECDPRELSRR